MSPADVKIVPVKGKGDEAVLNATGTSMGEMSMGERNEGTVNRDPEKGQWNAAGQSWTNAE